MDRLFGVGKWLFYLVCLWNNSGLVRRESLYGDFFQWKPIKSLIFRTNQSSYLCLLILDFWLLGPILWFAIFLGKHIKSYLLSMQQIYGKYKLRSLLCFQYKFVLFYMHWKPILDHYSNVGHMLPIDDNNG